MIRIAYFGISKINKNLNAMLKCYYCDEPINGLNKSEEHVIQNSLGGRLKSLDLLCKICNNDRLRPFDVEIAKQIYLTTVLDIKKQTGETQKVLGQTGNGRMYLVDNKLTPQNPKLIVNRLENGVVSYIVRNKEEAKKIITSWKKKNPTINIKEELEKIISIQEKVDGFVYFDSALVYGEKGFKAILKIALNYYFYTKQAKEYVNYPLSFLKGKIAGNYNNIVFHYYRELNSIFKINNLEILHLIYLKGDNKERLLYCYIELFNVHCFLIILNYNYYGNNFEKTYCYDLNEKIEVGKHIELNIKKNDISTYKPPIALGKDSLSIFDNRLARVYDIKNIKYEFTTLNEGMYIVKNGYSEKNI